MSRRMFWIGYALSLGFGSLVGVMIGSPLAIVLSIMISAFIWTALALWVESIR